ncbi:hypothetical protein BST96_14940 [Oceanicoccus sagamiensis]|uniref:HTH araC/xylS-type domain-containing protein n=2 Tax=Oceanicoccus sagamiensis TaxID=716816 RepID=A0A1X9NHG6_9GAMM|nr:hypothetical protein BST96_14940 [Oceanicoccus sagamiensis]
MQYRVRINRSLEFIFDNLHRPISLAEAAEKSHFSSFHFHRIFSAYMGETLNDFVTRIRLERSANWLIIRPLATVTEIALEAGFSSSANFSKAFKLHFGLTPTQIRRASPAQRVTAGRIREKYGKDFNLKQLNQIREPNSSANERLAASPEIRIEQLASMSAYTPSEFVGYNVDEVGRAWDKLKALAGSLGVPVSQQRHFSICKDNPLITPLEKCRYEALLVLEQPRGVSDEFKCTSIPAGRYAVAKYVGELSGLFDFYMAIYLHWLPDSGYEPDDYPLMERYLNDARVDGYAEIEVYIKLIE